jgi:hypothetical protein
MSYTVTLLCGCEVYVACAPSTGSRTHGSSNGNRSRAASVHMAWASGCSSGSSWRIRQTIRSFSNGSRTKHLLLVRSETGEPRSRPGRRAQVNDIELVVHAL